MTGQPIPAEQRYDLAQRLKDEGKGVEDIAVALYGRADGMTVSAARGVLRVLEAEQGGR